MKYDLAQMARRAGKTRRKAIVLPAIEPTQSLALELAGIVVEVVRAWSDRRQDILRAYGETLDQVKARDAKVRDTQDEIEDEIEEAAQYLERLVLELEPKLRDWTIKVEEWHRKKFRAAVLTASGVDLSTVIGPDGETMESFQRSIMALVRNVSEDTRGRIAGAVWRGFQQRTPRREVAREIAKAVNMGRKRALFIAQDQTVKMSGRLDQARQEQAGFEEYVWHHSRKARPRPEHVVRDGKRFKWKKPPADGHPGTQPHCGCKARAYLDLE